ncbi:hypothetical protein [Collimonas arenae]|uniref:hypothetical protein n=1 Tax=Collimonas arenae TaxID=279058 RepID=UPI000FE1499A|nr:hypothetical protein [Collimonas arenae]
MMTTSQLPKQELLAWLYSNSFPWQNTKILNWCDVLPGGESVERSPFTLSRKSDLGPIDMRLIVGQWEHYAGQTWFDAPTNPQYKEYKVRHTIKRFDSEREYYFSQARKDIYVDSVDGKYWNSTGLICCF